MDFDRRIGVVYGSAYCGSVKKLIFTVMNYMLPGEGILPLHCSANEGPKGDCALLLGLSGTGKTTLSADPSRALLGDDEHGWSDNGIANFEFGCYAKLIDLNPEKEPEIHRACFHKDEVEKHGAIIENAMMYPDGSFDLYDERLTPNSQGLLPAHVPLEHEGVEHVRAPEDHPLPHGRRERRVASDREALPRAGDVLVPHGLHEQARRHRDGHRGPREHVLAVLRRALHAEEPRRVRVDCSARGWTGTGPTVYLVNTGWTGGPFGTGKRFDITLTRRMVSAALSGDLAKVRYECDPVFKVAVPTSCPGVEDASILRPVNTWSDAEAYEERAKKLAAEFAAGYKKAYGDKGIDPAVAAECPG